MRFFVLLLALLGVAQAQTRQMVITIDDLPRGGDDASANDYASIRLMTAKLLGPLRGTKAIGFVNPGSEKSIAMGGSKLQSILQMWRDHGLDLGNHTNTHPNINQVPLERYKADVLAAEAALTEARGARSVYYRHPFLFTGKDEATRTALAAFLEDHKYVVAPVTVDNSDWMFAAVYAAALKKDAKQAARIRNTYLTYMETMVAFFEQRGKEVVGEEFPQILLIHANQLNADAMPDVLAMLRGRGYQFVSLGEALRHPAYQLTDGYTGPWGISWIHRWAKAKGMATTGEPAETKEILGLFKAIER